LKHEDKSIIAVLAILSLPLAWSCSKDKGSLENDKKATLQMNITDARCTQSETKSLKTSVSGDIIDPEKLTEFEVSFSGIFLKDSADNLVTVMNSTTAVDLRSFRGTVKELLPVEIPLGNFKALVVKINGVSITYDNNTYQASTTQAASVTIGSVSQTISTGIPNPFTSDMLFEIPLNVQMTDTVAVQGIRLFFDAEASCSEIAIDVPVIGTVYFAGMRDAVNISAIVEENIQQIKHSPPSGFELTAEDNINYYGLHTFVDFAEKGGVINSHTSQHVFRGEDGTLLVDAEDMEVNASALSVTTISAVGETETRADEVFKYATIKTNLANAGYNLESGKTYYFSLRKTWNITSNGKTYNLTRLCEPIPVVCP
jgi:hypothetical protein